MSRGCTHSCPVLAHTRDELHEYHMGWGVFDYPKHCGMRGHLIPCCRGDVLLHPYLLGSVKMHECAVRRGMASDGGGVAALDSAHLRVSKTLVSHCAAGGA